MTTIKKTNITTTDLERLWDEACRRHGQNGIYCRVSGCQPSHYEGADWDYAICLHDDGERLYLDKEWPRRFQADVEFAAPGYTSETIPSVGEDASEELNWDEIFSPDNPAYIRAREEIIDKIHAYIKENDLYIEIPAA
ncbi:MAG: hypothetical protein LBP78_07160 [Acidaminococcales bacterium]|jgi:hypothetical protein|nr:hypothetical protein [Acidaminococcales bacterium]